MSEGRSTLLLDAAIVDLLEHWPGLTSAEIWEANNGWWNLQTVRLHLLKMTKAGTLTRVNETWQWGLHYRYWVVPHP